ncbi:hypothetical protein ACTXG7_00355 [Mycolicibacterium sp. Dal123E01]|uniref:hypothetical protein n=1 Tax=Mycolicibacterium sp. Dal123E01 TaxID=3457578 RepID=UPI00403E8F61
MGHNVFRQSVIAGGALAAAGALAWAPVPALSEGQLSAVAPRVVVADVVPTANYVETFAAAAVETFEASVHALTTEAPELWRTVQDDWIDERLTGRNYARVAELLLLPVVPFVSGPFTHEVARALSEQFPAYSNEIEGLFEAARYAAIRVVGPLLSAFAGAGEAHAGIFRPMTTWDIPGFLVAVVKAPVYVIDGLLNGGYGDLGPLLGEGFDGKGTVIAPPGLLTPWGAKVTPRNIDGPLPTEQESVAGASFVPQERLRFNQSRAGTPAGAKKPASSATKAGADRGSDDRSARKAGSARKGRAG